MKSMKKIGALTFCLCALSYLIFCKKPADNDESGPATGTLSISFNLSQKEQTVIWLEDGDGGYIRTLFVSAWMAFEGFSSSRYADVCPSWKEAAQWHIYEPTTEEHNAVTGATPNGDTEFTYEIADMELEKGQYRFCVETSFTDEDSNINYSVLYRGTIQFGSSEAQSSPSAEYSPSQPPSGDILSNVQGRYTP